MSDEQLSKVLRNGIPQAGMPSFAALGPAKLAATLSHLRLLQGKGVAPVHVGDAERGKALFTGKAGCSQCHTVKGAGGFLGPDLTSYAANRPGSEIRGAIVNADQRSGVRKALASAKTRDGQVISGLVRNEDNFSIQLQSLDGAFHFLTKSDLSELTFGGPPLMPEDYATKLSSAELDELAGYLLSVAEKHDGGSMASRTKKKVENEE